MPMITPQGGWDSNKTVPVKSGMGAATGGVIYAYPVSQCPSLPWGTTFIAIAVISAALGLIGSAHIPHSEASFIVQASCRRLFVGEIRSFCMTHKPLCGQEQEQFRMYMPSQTNISVVMTIANVSAVL